jgi:hypothetical protein
MLTRLAACFVSIGLLGNVAAGSANAPTPAIMIAPEKAAPSRAAVRVALEKRRAKNQAAFRAYRLAGVYPHNWVRFGPLNVWMDKEGHLCAAATMIDKDGKHELVIETGKTNNQIRLMNVTEGALLDWILTSGFTIEEIDVIQAPSIGGDEWMPVRDWSAEDARLRKVYARTDAWLSRHKQAGLDLAVDRLVKNKELAWQLVDGTL